ncbi:MAG: proton-conducting transporter membrane subunit [Halalkalicoccus sp.]
MSRPLATGAEVSSVRPLVAVCIAGLAIVLIGLFAARPRLRDATAVASALAMAAVVWSMLPGVRSGAVYVTEVGTLVAGVEIAFRADPLGIVFAATASVLYAVTALYSVGYLDAEGYARTRYFAALSVCLGAAMGVAFAPNLLVLFVCYELMTIGTYPLVVHDESEKARRVGYEYLAYVLGGGVPILAGTVIVFSMADTVAFSANGIDALAAAAATEPWLAGAAFALLVAGFGVKAALVPVHSWLPSAMVAPTPVSGILHAVAVVKSGVFGIGRVVLDVFGPELSTAIGGASALAVVAGLTILLSSLLALRQDELKRRLAYSTIAQLSYIVLGIALLAPASLLGALVHLPAHAVAKLTLFLCVGVLASECGIKRVSECAGVGARLPLTMAAFAVGALSLAGIPLLAGFVSKWFLLVGSAEAAPLALAVFFASGVLNVAYFWPIVYAAFFESPERADPKPVVRGPLGGSGGSKETLRADGGRSRFGETAPSMLVALALTAAGTVALGVAPDPVIEVARLATENALGVSP